MKKILVSLLILLVVFAGINAQEEHFNHVTLIASDFEDGTLQGWGPRGDADQGMEKVEPVTNVAHNGKYCVKISERTKTWQGIVHVLTESPVPGDTYAVNLWLYYDEGPDKAAFTFSVESNTASGGRSYQNVQAVQCKKGEWTECKLEYVVGPDPTVTKLLTYFESPYKSDAEELTANDTLSFYMDDVEIIKLDPASKPKVEEANPNLCDVFSDYFNMGVALTGNDVDTSSQKARLIMKHFNTIVAGNEMKPDATQPNEGEFTWEKGESIVEFGELTGMNIRGHCLVWHSQTPAWFFQDAKDPSKPASKSVLKKRMENHIKTVMGHYKGSVYSWDVVNEVISDSTGTLRNGAEGSKWFEIYGQNYIVDAFKCARKADPDAELVINEYGVESNPKKRQALYDLVKDLKKKKLVDAVGLQMHISVGNPSIKDIKETIDMFGELGVKVIITELDVSMYESEKEDKKNYTEELLNKQATRYKELFDVFKAASKKGYMDTVMIWGITDDGSWKNDFPVQGRTDAPLLFDKRLKGKPAFWAIVED